MAEHNSQRLRQLLDKNTRKKTNKPPIKWRALLALALVYIIVLFELEWAWGIFFLLIVIPDIRTGVTYFVDEIPRNTHPITFWLIILTWIALSLIMFSTLWVDYQTLFA